MSRQLSRLRNPLVASENRTPSVQQLELAHLIKRYAPRDGSHATLIASLTLFRFSAPTEKTHEILQPACCFSAQGSKQLILGNDVYLYDPDQYVVVSVDLPLAARIVQASPETPYLGLRLDLDPYEISSLVLEANLALPAEGGNGRGVYVSGACTTFIDAMLRLLRLLDSPKEIPVLAPMVRREIFYRLLTGERSAQLLRIAVAGSQAQRIAKAIAMLRKNFDQPLRIESIARSVNMSPSGLHHWFKAVTAMSPLQYQKQLRLQQARRLLMSDSVDASTAAYRVGYESPSQFSREYSRLFGAPPVRDIARLRDGSG